VYPWAVKYRRHPSETRKSRVSYQGTVFRGLFLPAGKRRKMGEKKAASRP